MVSIDVNKPARIATEGQNLSERAHDLIKQDIMSAALVPGEKLLIDALSERYGIGINPVREALNRLSSAGFVERRSQRGFFVAGMSIVDLEELVKTRILLETNALQQSMDNATEDWEERLILAYHRLARTQRLLGTDDVQHLNQKWEVLHKEFHMMMLAQCGSSWLLGFCSTMMDQSVRYRNLSVNFTKARRGDAVTEHQDILNAVLDRDRATATGLLEAHYTKTLEGLRAIQLEP